MNRVRLQRLLAEARRERDEAGGPGPRFPWRCKPEALDRAERAEAKVSNAMDRSDAALRAELLAELRGIAVGAVRELGQLVYHQTGRSAPMVRVQAARAVLALLEKAEAKVEDDRLRAVEAALREQGLLPPAEGGDAQPAPGADRSV